MRESWEELVPTANPAAGANFTRKVPGDTYETLLIAYCILTTSAVVANRSPYLELQNGDGLVIGRFTQNILSPATQVVRATWAIDIDTNTLGTGGPASCPIQTVKMQPGWRFVLGAVNLDGGDQFSAISMLIRREPSGPEAPSTGARPFDRS